MDKTTQDLVEMCEIITRAQPGQKLKVVFVDETIESLKEKLSFVVHMMPSNGNALSLNGEEELILRAVADSGEWSGCYEYTFTVLSAFDPNYFIRQVVNRGMVESVTIKQ